MAMNPPGPAEPGNTTSEYKLLPFVASFAGLAEGSAAVASAFGAHLTAAQTNAIHGLVAAVIVSYGAYAASRGIRKAGTPG